MKILLESHLPEVLAEQLRRPSIGAQHLAEWQGGEYLDKLDHQVLEAAYLDRRVLVTYDCRTIPALTIRWAEQGDHHAGVVLVDEKTISPSNTGALIRAITRLFEGARQEDWVDQVMYLPPGPQAVR